VSSDAGTNLRSIGGGSTGRIPPQNLDAERSVLGGVLLESSAFDEVQEIVKPADFYREAHRKVFEAMRTLSEKSEPIDRVTLKAELTKQGVFASIGGDDFIDLLDKVVPVTTNVAWYARIVREKAVARRLIEAAQAIATQGFEQAGDLAEFLDDAERRIFSVLEERAGNSAVDTVADAKVVLRRTMNNIEANYSRGVAVTGLPSGLTQLDALTTGWHPGKLILLAARPGVGKTIAALNWALNAAIRHKVTVAIFEMEMAADELMERMLAAEGRVDHQRIRTGQLLDSDWPKLAHAGGLIASASIKIDDGSNISALELRSKVRRIAREAPAERPLGLVIVDYLQLMKGNEQIESREQQIAEIARSMKSLARDMKIPIIALSQLNRSVEKRTDGVARLSDLRESGSLEQDADLVIFINRPWVLDKTKDPALAEFAIAKQRNGPPGTVPAEFRGEFMLFLDQTGTPAPPAPSRSGNRRNWPAERDDQ
jgi:replicative DNA helicase